ATEAARLARRSGCRRGEPAAPRIAGFVFASPARIDRGATLLRAEPPKRSADAHAPIRSSSLKRAIR
ncbi:hypothetical protein ACX83E_26515, partial [Burkholderia pseudomallei]